MPRAQCSPTWSHLKTIETSDPLFFQPSEVDILIGAKLTASLMLPEIIHGPNGTPVAQNTKFGWTLSGEINSKAQKIGTPTTHFVRTCEEVTDSSSSPVSDSDPASLDSSIEQFWRLEEPDVEETHLSVEDDECENHFISTHKRNQDGSYSVRLPFKKITLQLGNSRDLAIQRFQSVERRLGRCPSLKQVYTNNMQEYISSEFMELVPTQDMNKPESEVYYLPHHVVIKESSTTTKYGIVYDASAKTTTGVSLNDILLKGPKLQVDLLPLMIRFQSHLIAMSSDIVKFYPQFKVEPDHAEYRRLVWREDPHLPLQDFRLVRVTFGVKAAPCLAIRCLHQLAEDEREYHPSVADTIKEDFLVDNLLSGSHDVESALKIQNELLQVMAKGNLKLRKWMSNHPAIIQAVPPDQREHELSHLINQNESVKTIGILWQPKTDTFGISIVMPDLAHGSTKRKVLTSIARIFDPLGWLSPFTIKLKVLMQTLWKAKLDWDTPLPPQLDKKWRRYCDELLTIQQFRIDRCILRPYCKLNPVLKRELHGFSDGSSKAYSACVYSRTIDHNGQSVVTLVAAKSKVAPLKTETTPRLELCGAVLLSKLVRTIMDSLKIRFDVVRCWTDATIVLDWLSSDQKLKIFELNRVRKILHIISRDKWGHVSGEDSPADSPSRGIPVLQFLTHPLWLSGPHWLLTAEFQPDPIVMTVFPDEPSAITYFIKNCSSYTKIKRVIAYCLRFIYKCRSKIRSKLSGDQSDVKTGGLSSKEISSSLNHICRAVQAEEFSQEISLINKKLSPKSSMKVLTPFLDADGILRVGGRLQQSNLSYNQRHPVLLLRKHNFTEQVVRYYHVQNLHAGPQLLLALIRDQFWIVRGPDVVKNFVRKCVTCHRQNHSTTTQLMGQLPISRVTPTRAFVKTGVDYAGPFTLCLRTGRFPIVIKAYVSLFICMATRAIHLEFVSDLTTPAFIGALTRFISRRGLPSDISCDGGKNFIGAKNEMAIIQQFLKSNSHQQKLNAFCADRHIKFHVNPPLSPHHGGLWEAGVKSMKHHLRRVIEDRRLSIEEFLTLLTQVEACLNSRPLTPMSSDPSDFNFLTPGHFLTGGNLAALPQYDVTNYKVHQLSRWQLVQQMFQHFWKRWSSEYLSRLQSRPKWFSPQPNLKIGDFVLIRDEEPLLGPLKWKLGRILQVYPGKDGLTRVCDVKIGDGSVYKRPIVKLSPLPIDQ